MPGFFILIPSTGYDKQTEASGFSEIHLAQEISIVTKKRL